MLFLAEPLVNLYFRPYWSPPRAGLIYAMLYRLNKRTYSSLVYTGDVISELCRSQIISRLCSFKEAKLFEASPC